jgi:phosphatidylglycerophosphate synthase
MDGSSTQHRWLTRANALTGLRLAAVPFMANAILTGDTRTALALFVLAVATDLVDGRVARHYGEASPLGGVLDHATDAVFVASGLAAFAWIGEGTPWLAPAVLLAFAQYTLDSRVPSGRPLRASALGRWNGIAYFVWVGIPVVRDGLSLGWPSASFTLLLSWLLLGSTLVSIADRFSSHWRKS